MELISVEEFWKTRKEREEAMKTILVVAGVRVVVFLYDLLTKKTHEVYVMVDGKSNKKVTLRIPEIHIQSKEDLTILANALAQLAI